MCLYCGTYVGVTSLAPCGNRRVEEAEPYKEFIREITLRIERVLGNFVRQAREDRRESARRFDALQANTDTIIAELRELRQVSDVHTQALLRVLDRFDNGGPAAAT